MIRYVVWDVDRAASMGFVGAVQVCRFVAMAGGQNFFCTERDASILVDFAHIYGLDDYGAERISCEDSFAVAPDPEVYNFLIGLYQLPLDEVLVVSEREEAIMAGRMAGVRTCRLWAGTSADVAADWTVGSCSELCDLLRCGDILTDEAQQEPRYSICVGELLRYSEGVLQPEPIR